MKPTASTAVVLTVGGALVVAGVFGTASGRVPSGAVQTVALSCFSAGGRTLFGQPWSVPLALLAAGLVVLALGAGILVGRRQVR